MSEETYIEQLEANAAHLKKELDFFVDQFRISCGEIISKLPSVADTDKQRNMIYGSPRNYAQHQINGVGAGIDYIEAITRINKYLEEWNKRGVFQELLTISDEAIELACEALDNNIQSCDSGESNRERWLQEARDFIWSHHMTSKANPTAP